ncbi:intradiol ring-cleavage dioxygenase [Brevibacterium sp. BDJS002]|uniref:3,4-dioxygenase subunit beta n=1 Tax=Brevibacterium aurantiacum TaxID=273384 RepID=A0A2A3Z0R4_BREAU|nr:MULTISPECIES: intradiol ring-cleavage dioxygenase [Brevibacterium]MDN5711793.1 intradiol ring-cleavage dioxygenase [Brevibacterium aurantiacum]MDN5736160.1 intradiol ring-cleavage dioxygenase [Brevibacterium aurantiacum]MDN5738997.1 intradiol ring-cleavage dioxygenase [Brevibacterium aurantiacum]MDN5834012.1 intradiol ring-cleavage dioxygenase [Brevibacterium sp.]MDN5876511.1 intradiol ring-cleavage dioxygenase [Brevibacterium sp.]
MARVPEPEETPDGPTYEGRLLDHPDEEVVDQGAAFDIRTLFSRRSVLGVVGAGIGTVALAACGMNSASGSDSLVTEIPDETAGPYPADGSNGPDILEQSGIVRSDIRSNIDGSETVEGVALTFTLKVTDMANDNKAFEGVAVYAWHCDAQGRYSMYSEGVEDATWLRGVQVADEKGEVTFTSVFPACYTGRWTHIHFEIYPDVDSITDADNAIATSQMALPEDACNAVFELSAYDGSAENLSNVSLDDDNVFGDDGGEHQMATISGDTDKGYVASLDVPVDTGTEPTGGAEPGGGGGEGGEPPEGGAPPEGGTPAEGGAASAEK